MNKLFFLVIFALTLYNCASSKIANTVTGDGSSFETAVVAKSISSEYEWVREHYPNSQMQMQSLVQRGKKNYDVLTIQTDDGSTRKVYFDIDSFFGKSF